MKKSLKSVLDICVYSNLFVAVCAYFFSWQAKVYYYYQWFYEGADAYPLLFALSVFFVYGIQRLFLIHKLSKMARPVRNLSERSEWLLQNKFLMALLLSTAGIAIAYLVFFISWKLIIYFLPFLLVSILYFAGPFPLRKIRGLKSFLIAAVWALVAFGIPVLLFGFSKFGISYFYFAMAQFFLIATLCLPFDIRDYAEDISHKINSLPVVIGITKSKWLGVFLTALYFCFALKSAYLVGANLIFSTTLTSVYMLTVLIFSSPARSPYFFSFFGDGGILFQTLIQFLFLFLSFA